MSFTHHSPDGSSETSESAAGLDWQIYPRMPRQPRGKPMAVICLGLSRTGTMSTYAALKQLGYNCYHFAEMGCDVKNGSMRKWREAVEVKYYNGKGKKMEGAEDFDEMLWRYDATTDTPTVLFAEELIAAYPDAKVVLTERDPDEWVRSVHQVFIGILDLRIWRFLEYVDWEYAYNFMFLLRSSLDIWTGYCGNIRDKAALKKGYIEYNERIKRICPKDRLLVWHPRDGWEPLCRHLGKDVPEGAFPKINEGKTTYDMFAVWFWKFRLMVALKVWCMRLIPVAVVGVAAWWIWRQ